jgi:hypothetical protein
MIPSLSQIVKDWLPPHSSSYHTWDVREIDGWNQSLIHFIGYKFGGFIGIIRDDHVDISPRPNVSAQKLQVSDPQFFEKLRNIMNTVEELYKK